MSFIGARNAGDDVLLDTRQFAGNASAPRTEFPVKNTWHSRGFPMKRYIFVLVWLALWLGIFIFFTLTLMRDAHSLCVEKWAEHPDMQQKICTSSPELYVLKVAWRNKQPQ